MFGIRNATVSATAYFVIQKHSIVRQLGQDLVSPARHERRSTWVLGIRQWSHRIEAEIDEQLRAMMPPGVPPIALFRTFVRNLP